ncbi:MAG: hypothetical protein Q9218_002096 [Villophora microphyllina]
MASAARSRLPASSAHRSAHSIGSPAYEPLTHTLNPAAQHALHNLPTTHSLNDLKRRLQIAVSHLTEITGDLNDQYQARKAENDKAKARRAARAREMEGSQAADDEDGEGDWRMEEISKDVDDRTKKMDEGTRRVIDVQARVDGAETALKELDANAVQTAAATQSTLGASQYRLRSQHQRRQRDADYNDDNGDEDEDENSTQRAIAHTGPGALEAFKTKVSASSTVYNALSLQDRYASHNDYIGFRKIVHDARHPNDDTPLPHPSIWFPSSNPNSNAANDKNLSRSTSTIAGADASDSDPEIQIAREKRSIRCPLTLLLLHDPLTSTLCPHSFEKSAILGMLAASTLRAPPTQGARTGEKALKCPECSILLTASMLKADPVLVRKIRRIEEQERREREGSGDDDDADDVHDGRTRRRAEEVTSSPVGSRGLRDEEKVKKERMSQMSRGAGRDISVVPDSQAGAMVIDDDNDDEEVEEEDE